MPTIDRPAARRFYRTMILLLLAGALSSAPGLAASSDWGREVVDRWSFEVGAQAPLTLDLHDADVEIREGAPRRIEVEVELASNDLERARERYDEIGLTAKAIGDGVEIRSERERDRVRWTQRYGWGITVRVTAPASIDLDARTGDGDVTVESIDGRFRVVTGDGDVEIGRARSDELTLRTGDGEIDARDLVVGTAEISTGDGNVSIDRLDAERASLSSGDGDIEIDAAGGSLDVGTGDGDVRVTFDRFEGATLGSGDGDVRIELPAGVGAELDLEGEEVALRGEVGGFHGRADDDEIEGTLGGGGPRLKARSGDGSVVVRIR